MNPMTNMKNIQKLSERELELGVSDRVSWHNQYKDSAYVFVGGLPYDLTEGDILSVFSQYGEIVNLNLVRDKNTGKSKGYCFIAYEDQRSTVLAVDNFNGMKLLKRTIRVDHVTEYKKPKEDERDDVVTKAIRETGVAPQVPSTSASKNTSDQEQKEKKQLIKKEEISGRGREGLRRAEGVKIKNEKQDPGYEHNDRHYRDDDCRSEKRVITSPRHREAETGRQDKHAVEPSRHTDAENTRPHHKRSKNTKHSKSESKRSRKDSSSSSDDRREIDNEKTHDGKRKHRSRSPDTRRKHR